MLNSEGLQVKMGEEGTEGGPAPDFELIKESTGLDHDQIDSLKKGFDGFDKDHHANDLEQYGVECKKDDMDTYSAEVDEEASGKFTFMMFCAVNNNK